MKIKYLIGIFVFAIITIASKFIYELYIPEFWQFTFASIMGQIGFATLYYFFTIKE